MAQPVDVLLYPDPRFSRAAPKRPLDAALIEIGARLLATAQHHRAYGLAATHIGLVDPVVVVSLGPPDKRDYQLLYNPEVVATSGALVGGPEGSVSLPGIEVDIIRPETAEIAYDDGDGIRRSLSLSGFAARVAQHEIDQVNGVFFLDRLSRLKRDAALRRYRKLAR